MIDIRNYKRTLTVTGASLMAVAGTCLGYLWAHRELEEEFNRDLEKLLDIEAQRLQQHYAIRYKDAGPEAYSELDDSDPENPVVSEKHIIIPKEALATAHGRAEVMQMLADQLEEDAEDEETEKSEVDEAIEQNAFEADDTPQYDLQELMAERTGSEPFIISQEEYFQNNPGYEQLDLTFFDKDGVLIDDQENAIPDTDLVVGDRNLQRFGMMSGDNNVVYVQNDKSSCMFRVERNMTMTASEALYGIDEEEHIEHSSMKRRRPRLGDDG